MTEKIQNTFKSLGFDLEKIDDVGHTFKYEGVNYIWLANEDENYLSIGIPAIAEEPDEEDVLFYRLVDKFNGTLKYIKLNIVGDSLWMFYERELFGDEEDLEKIVTRMIVQLDMALCYFKKLALEAQEYDDEEDEDGSHCIISDIDVVEEDQNK